MLVLDSVAEDGEINVRVRLDPALQDTSQMLHIGAVALLVRKKGSEPQLCDTNQLQILYRLISYD